MLSQEHYYKVHEDIKTFVSYGLPFDEACAKHVSETFKSSRVYIITSRSIAKSETWPRLLKALGQKVVGIFTTMSAHSPWDDCFAVAKDLTKLCPDLIVSIGGGSVIDGSKMARFLAANGALTPELRDELVKKAKATAQVDLHTVKPVLCHTINIVTSLSAAECSNVAGITDPETHYKEQIIHDSLFSDLNIYDPVLTLTSPESLWLESGIRAVDHFTEAISGNQAGATEELRQKAEECLGTVLSNLLAIRTKNWDDLEARLKLQVNMTHTWICLRLGVGASHGIGHQLGTYGIGHGATSAIIMPSVLKYNYAHGDNTLHEHQKRVQRVFWSQPEVAKILSENGLTEDTSDAGDLMDCYIRTIGLPRTFKGTAISKADFETIAINSMKDFACSIWNPAPIDVKGVLEILRTIETD